MTQTVKRQDITGDESKTGQSSHKISAVPPEQADYVWLSQLPAIEKALARGPGQPPGSLEMLQNIKMGKHSLWAMHDDDEILAVIVLSVFGHGTDNKKLFIELLAGTGIKGLMDDQLEQLLIDCRDIIGAKSVETFCRPGLAEYMARRKTGWRKKAIVMELK